MSGRTDSWTNRANLLFGLMDAAEPQVRRLMNATTRSERDADNLVAHSVAPAARIPPIRYPLGEASVDASV